MRLFARLFGCRHAHRLLERRALGDTGPLVLHLVCEACHDAIPAMRRSRAEHYDAVEAGRVLPLKVTRERSGVVKFVRKA